MSYRSTLTVSELTSSGGQQGRVLALHGPSLPFMGAEWSMKVNVVTTWYPGNPDEATQQVLGPQELPSRWQGEWRRTLMGKQPAAITDETGDLTTIVNPADLRDLFEDIARGGRRLRVVWGVTSDTNDPSATGKLTREGRITNLTFKHTRLQDIEWEIEFAWQSRGATQSKVSSTRASTVNSNSGALRNKVNALVAANIAASFASTAPSNLTLGQIEALADYPSKLVTALASRVQQIASDVGAVVSIAATLSSQPVQIANRALNLARNTMSDLNSFADTLSQVPLEQLSTKSDLASLLQALNAFFPQVDAARDAATTGQQFAAELQQEIQSLDNAGLINPQRLTNPNAAQQVYVCKAGDTPALVSQRFYQTPDHAVDILRANKLSWYTPTLPAGKILIIPVLQSNNVVRQV